jgi:hypothetical protein
MVEIAIFWFQIHIANGLNFMHRKWHTGNQYMVKSAENRMRSNLELLLWILGMIEIEILLTFVYFLECTVVQCKDALSIYWNRHDHDCSRIWKLSANFTFIQCNKHYRHTIVHMGFKLIWDEVPTIVEIAIFWYQIHITNGLNFMHRKWYTGNQYMVCRKSNAQ